MQIKELEAKAQKLRQDIILEVFNAGSGHPGGSLSCADIITALYFDEMNIDPENPEMEGRDRFVLSKGHAAPALYAALAERGFFPADELKTLRKLGSRLQGHPSMKLLPGIEMSTGSLGQGISAATGMALAEKINGSAARVYTILGDGELQEGLVWEASMAAAHYKLDNLCAFVDHNGLQIDGRNEDVMNVMPIAEKFKAFGWNVLSCNAHNMEEILECLAKAREFKGKPTVVVAESHKGRGVSFMTDNAGWHGKAPNEEQARQAMEELGGSLQ